MKTTGMFEMLVHVYA